MEDVRNDVPQPFHVEDVLPLPPPEIGDIYPNHENIDSLLNQLEQQSWDELGFHPAPLQPLEDVNHWSLQDLPEGWGFWPVTHAEESSAELESSQQPFPSASLQSEGNVPDERPLKKKPYQRLPSAAVKVLRAWLYQHRDYPYPTEQEREDMAQCTGLDKTQISNWFSNTRRRRLAHGPRGEETSRVDNSLLSPMERWRNSPPESEAATTSDIMRALEDSATPYLGSDCSTTYTNTQDGLSSNDSSNSFIFGALSASSFEHSQHSQRSRSSSSEVSFNQPRRPILRPPTPIPSSTKPRRRRRRLLAPTVRNRRPATQGKRAYQCTFCSDSFRTKYDWQRHEKALHLPVDLWCCAPHGGVVEVDGINVCAFCQAPGADYAHLDAVHNFLVCREKGNEQRAFPRKDHLRQHLKLTHNVDFHPSMESWRHSRTYLISRCGFCDCALSTWEERVEHLAEHFKNGADMVQWKGDWGFETSIHNLVENAIPPYLLGHERQTMDPWKISDALGTFEKDEDSPLSATHVPNGLTRYTNLQRELVTYIRAEINAGRPPPSDLMIQDLARQIAYGSSSDHWNQTYADDPRWLLCIKQEAGIMQGVECSYLPPINEPPS